MTAHSGFFIEILILILKNKDYYYETKNIRSFSFSICGLTKYLIFLLAKGYITSDGFGYAAL